MRVFYATSIKYPSPLANRMQVADMSRAFQSALGDAFLFGGRNLPPDTPGMTLERIEGSKRSFVFAWRTLSAVARTHATHVYCREKRLLFFMLLYRPLFPALRLVRFYFEEHAEPEKAWWYRFVLRNVDGVVCLSPIIERDIHAQYPTVRTLVASHGVAVEIFDIPATIEEARSHCALPQVFTATYIGSLSTMGGVQKGGDVLLAALSRVLAVVPIRLLLVGPGEEDARTVREKAQRMNLGAHVHITQRVTREEVAWYQKASDVLLLPLLPNEYTHMLPLKVFEYMLSKRLIIASRLPSLEGTLDETNAMLVEPNDARALAEALIRAAQHMPEKAERAYQHALSHTWEARAKTIVSFMNV